MKIVNQVYVEFPSNSINEGFARSLISAFISQIDPTVEELEDVKTAISEVVTNSIIHGYDNQEGMIGMKCVLYEDSVEIICTDFGGGIKDIQEARQPLFTSKPHLERSGMGFTIMENFMDSLHIASEMNKGTTVKLFKKFRSVSNK
jgi:stage II sporulation protein AB (anti-sigma F factor)